jgi:hypothetical protein
MGTRSFLADNIECHSCRTNRWQHDYACQGLCSRRQISGGCFEDTQYCRVCPFDCSISETKDVLILQSRFSAAVKANWNHPTFAEAARIVYTTTTEEVRDLRNIVTAAIDEHPSLLRRTEVKKVVRPIPDLCWDLVCNKYDVTDEPMDTDESSCPECGAATFFQVTCSKGRCGATYSGCCHLRCSHCGTED